MKIAIIGNAGSGKSTLAQELHTALQIPLYHLDQYFWKPGWQEPDRVAFELLHNALCDQNSWIIEGMAIRFAQYRFAHADVIIFLDMPRHLCFYRMIKRVFMHFGTVYFSSAPGCPEHGPSWKFLKFMWQFKYKQRESIRQLLLQHARHKKIYVFTQYDKKEAFIEALLADIKKH